MIIKAKFNLGEKVYILNKDNYVVSLFVDEICEIILNKNGVYYYGYMMSKRFKENELVPYNDKEELLNKIKELTSKGDDC